MKKSLLLPLLGGVTCLLFACGGGRKVPDPEVTDVSLTFKRFDRSLFDSQDGISPARVKELRGEYGEFFDLFCMNMIRIPDSTDEGLAAELSRFVTDPEVRALQRKIDSVYASTASAEQKLLEFVTYHKHHFPDRSVPAVYAYNSAFNYAVVATDSVIGVGLEMFLGENEESYSLLGYPKYMFRTFSPEYIPVACAKGWFQSDHDPSGVKGDLISQMVYHGKMLYYLGQMLPSCHDSLITGYSAGQLDWCTENEARIWSFFIERKLLFSTDPSEYVKYVNDGPTTSGFPPESPGKIGAWIGWQIVNKFMDKHPEVTLDSLLKINDAVKVLEGSSYKPERGT